MKRALLLAAITAAGLGVATESHAFSIQGTYAVTFVQGGATQCLVLTSTGAVSPYRDTGTWYSTTFANWQGTYVVLAGIVHLAGPFGSPISGYTTFDGKISGTKLTNTTYDEFDPNGNYFAAGAGRFTEQKNSSFCGGASHTRLPSGP